MMPPDCQRCGSIATHVILSNTMTRCMSVLQAEDAPPINVSDRLGGLQASPTPYMCRDCAERRVEEHQARRGGPHAS